MSSLKMDCVVSEVLYICDTNLFKIYKMKNLFLFIIVLFASNILNAQIDLEYKEFYDRFYSSKVTERGTFLEENSNFEGSPYSNEKFIKGNVEMRDGSLYKNIPLRYNIYFDHMEFERDKKAYYIVETGEILTVKFDDKTYVYETYSKHNKIKSSFFLLHTTGKVQLLEKQKVDFKYAEKEAAYKEAKPARFKESPSNFYVKFEGKPAMEIKRRKDIAKLFPSHKEEIAKYVKKKRVSIRDVAELKDVIAYYSELCAQ